jgi:hypothetical protein
VRQPGLAETQRKIAPMEGTHAPEMHVERLNDRLGQHRDSVLRALAVSDENLAVRKIDILHPQLQTLSKTQPGAVQQARHQPLRPFEIHEHPLNLVLRQHHRQAKRAFRAHQIVEPGKIALEHAPVQKQDRRERLILRRRGNVPFRSEPAEKRGHLARPSLPDGACRGNG